MMQLLISDANILIDLEEGQILGKIFELEYTFAVPDILYFEELEENHNALLGLGLKVKSITAKSMQYAQQLIYSAKGPSRNDCFALVLAKQESCPLLTGDKALRKLANKEKLAVMGTIWLVDELLKSGILSYHEAKAAFDLMRANARRLPWDTVNKMLEKYDTH